MDLRILYADHSSFP
jgi:hypothetical protein